MNRSKRNFRRHSLKFIPIVILIVAALAGIVMLLWNAILPEVIHVSTITYWQSLGLLVLSRILFGGFKPGPPRGRSPFGRQEWREKWMNMSEEERRQFKEQWRDKCRSRD